MQESIKQHVVVWGLDIKIMNCGISAPGCSRAVSCLGMCITKVSVEALSFKVHKVYVALKRKHVSALENLTVLQSLQYISVSWLLVCVFIAFALCHQPRNDSSIISHV